jgi:iron-sulfur cluster repair protein YtfE (RIC family)
MAGLTTFFQQDHRSCDARWAKVEAAADAGDGAAVSAAFQAFDTQMRRHLGWEEQVLFPAFEEATGMVGGPTAVMRHEHTQMRAVLDQMQAANTAGDHELLVDHGDTLLMLIQQHNAKEEQMLYPMAERALGGAWEQLRGRLV